MKTTFIVALAIAQAVVAAGCGRPRVSAFEALPIRIEQPLGADLRIGGLDVTTQPDRRSWRITVYSTAVTGGSQARIWIHAYPQESPDYFTLDPANAAPAIAGQVRKDDFTLPRPGAFNLYAGVYAADGSLGPAVGLGWIGVGDPDTPEYHRAYRFLQEADDERAAAMLAQTQRAYPSAKLP